MLIFFKRRCYSWLLEIHALNVLLFLQILILQLKIVSVRIKATRTFILVLSDHW